MPLDNPLASTDNIWRDQDMDRCLSDDLDVIEAAIDALEISVAGKADSGHEHGDIYATAEHKHDQSSVIGLEDALNEKAMSDHNHDDDYAASVHDHDSSYAASNHNHDDEYIAKVFQLTSDTGSFKYAYTTSDGVDIIDKIEALDIGMHTMYSQSGVSGNPKSIEAWRFLIHKTTASVIWVLGFGSMGSVYTNYLDTDNGWRGWKAIYNATSSVLWSGEYYMISTQTATPSKTLSECRTGWMLIWSDYDADDSAANNADYCTTVIPKWNPSGSTWSGQLFLCDVPRYYGSDTSDVTTERRIIKSLYIYDDKIVGHASNNLDTRADVVLRAVYEM